MKCHKNIKIILKYTVVNTKKLTKMIYLKSILDSEYILTE